MKNENLDRLIGQLSREGVIEAGARSPKRGVTSTLRKMSELDYLGYSGKERDQLVELAVEIEQIAEQWHTDYPPLFAVTGLKNAGKSSLVKGFLSENGRLRTPTGIESDFATRRYVFWLPQAWQCEGDVSPFEEMLRRVFGSEAEQLSGDPVIASQQYREDLGSKGMQRPLVAYDRKLDDWKFGIVDCPDIETGDGKVETRLSEAREMLEKASRLCAAFVVIAQHENLERDILWKILRIVREVGKKSNEFLVINKCPPKPASQIRDDLLKLAKQNGFMEESVDLMASYDFTKRGAERFAVAVTGGSLPDGCATGDEDLELLDTLLPTFFVCDSDGPHPPEPIAKSRLLHSKVQNLSSEQLKRQFQMQMVKELESVLNEANMRIAQAGQLIGDLVKKSYDEIPGVLLAAMTMNGVVSPLQNRKLADRQVQLLIDEAPLTIRLSMRATNWIRQSLTSSVEFIKGKLIRKAEKWIREGEKRLRKDGTKVDANEVARSLCGRASFGRIVGKQKFEVVANWVNLAFYKFSQEFDQDVEPLRPLVKQYYDKMSGWDLAKAHAWAVGALMALIVAALMIPADGGASLYGISVLEGMLAAAVGATGIQLLQARREIAKAEKPLIEGQLAFLTAEIGAHAGLPSYGLQNLIEMKVGNVTYQLPPLPKDVQANEPIVTVFHVDEGFMTQLRESLTVFLASEETA